MDEKVWKKAEILWGGVQFQIQKLLIQLEKWPYREILQKFAKNKENCLKILFLTAKLFQG